MDERLLYTRNPDGTYSKHVTVTGSNVPDAQALPVKQIGSNARLKSWLAQADLIGAGAKYYKYGETKTTDSPTPLDIANKSRAGVYIKNRYNVAISVTIRIGDVSDVTRFHEVVAAEALAAGAQKFYLPANYSGLDSPLTGIHVLITATDATTGNADIIFFGGNK